MQPLLRIQSVPITVEYTTTRAALRHNSTQPSANVTRSRGRANIQTTPPKVEMDSYETRASAGLKSAPRSVQEFAQAGKAAAQQATREFAEAGNRVVDSHGKGNPVVEAISNKVMTTTETAMAFIPSVPLQIMTQPGNISFDYSMDKLNYDWNTQTRPQLEYVPGGVEFSVTQYPDVVIEYVGDPIYVPASANPNYDGE